MAKSECINWIFGRGLSIGCNLSWSVPSEWRDTPRDEKIELIKVTLRKEMNATSVDSSIIQHLLRFLERHTVHDWRNRFITTNWDYLLQKEIQALERSEARRVGKERSTRCEAHETSK